jgi:hypothetical protein
MDPKTIVVPSRQTPPVDGGNGLSMDCELCGQPLQRFRLSERGNGTGPWQEYREHPTWCGSHVWTQDHNCEDPQPDTCWFCEPTDA